MQSAKISYDKKSNMGKESKAITPEVCRLCMSENARIKIFPEKADLFSNKEPPLFCKIMSSVNIQVRKDDGLPTHICVDCACKVEETYSFLRLCEISDSFLRQYLDFGLQMSFLLRYSELLRMVEHSEEEGEGQNNDF